LWKQKSNFTFISNGEFRNQLGLVAIPCVIELFYVQTATEKSWQVDENTISSIYERTRTNK